MLSMLLAYDAAGNVMGTLDFMVTRDPSGAVVGLVNFAAIEGAGSEMTTVWMVDGAQGSKVWPEWIGARAHEFRVELGGPPGARRIAALVHKVSGVRRERDAIERAIAARIAETPDGAAVDLRDIVGGPDKPLPLDTAGSTVAVDAVDGAGPTA